MFGDLSVMEMTVNHISAVLSKFGDPAPARWMQPEHVAQPRLIVNYVRSGSYVADVITAGVAVSKLNGHPVRTLADFRKYLIPENKKGIWTLETDAGKYVALMFNNSLVEQINKADAYSASYLLTPGIVDAAAKLGL